MPADFVAHPQRPLEIHAATGGKLAEIRPRERLLAGLKREAIPLNCHHRQAAPVERDARPDRARRRNLRLANDQPHARRLRNHRRHLRQTFNETSEHIERRQ